MAHTNCVSIQPTFILHRRAFRETSLIVDALTLNYGKVALLVKGVRGKRSVLSAILQPFIPLKCSWLAQSDLSILTNVETLQMPFQLTGTSLYSALYISELVGRLLHRHDPHPLVFTDYQASLNALVAGNEVEPVLRYFEFSLLQQLGYGIQTDYEANQGNAIEADKLYNYRLDQGPCEVHSKGVTYSNAPIIQGATLIALSQRKLHNQQQLKQAKLLMRYAIYPHLRGQALKSRTLFKPNQPL